MVPMGPSGTQDILTADVNVYFHHLRCNKCQSLIFSILFLSLFFFQIKCELLSLHVCIHACHCPGSGGVWGNQLAHLQHHMEESHWAISLVGQAGSISIDHAHCQPGRTS